jgi:hypothetical protein
MLVRLFRMGPYGPDLRGINLRIAADDPDVSIPKSRVGCGFYSNFVAAL